MVEAQGRIGQAASSVGRQSEERAEKAQLACVRSAYGSAEGIIRLADEKAGYVLLFFGILVVTLSLRPDSLLRLLFVPSSPLPRLLGIGGLLVFLGAAGVSLFSGVRSRMLSPDPPGAAEEILCQLTAADTTGFVGVLGRRFHVTAGIALWKLCLLERCLGWAVVSFLGWTAAPIMSVAM